MEKRIKKYWQGKLHSKEKRQLLDDLANLKQEINSGEVDFHVHLEDQQQEVPYDSQSLLEKIHTRLEGKESKWKLIKLKFISRIAATLVLVLGTSLLFYQIIQGTKESSQLAIEEKVSVDSNDISFSTDSVPSLKLPNGNIAVLQLANEETAQLQGFQVVKREDGAYYFILNQNSNGSIEEGLTEKKLVFSSPKGYTNKLVLMDGTIVWLNSGSSLEYPMAFERNSRTVTLKGEAYFDVRHSSTQPFYVETTKATVKVLGTSFNISSYQEDGIMKTTLVEGSVQLNTNTQKIVLEPGEQAIMKYSNSKVTKQNVNVADYTSWKDGYFNFNGLTTTEILNMVKRWYDIEEVVYAPSLSQERITGTFRRTKSLGSLLAKLEKISETKFEIKGRRVMVLKE